MTKPSVRDFSASRIRPELASRGFEFRDGWFTLKGDRSIGRIQVQRRSSAPPGAMLLTANIGVQVPEIDQLLAGAWTPATENHWEERLGFLSSYADDHWWLIAPDDQAGDESREFVLAITNEGVAAALGKMDLARLRDHWLSDEPSWAS